MIDDWWLYPKDLASHAHPKRLLMGGPFQRRRNSPVALLNISLDPQLWVEDEIAPWGSIQDRVAYPIRLTNLAYNISRVRCLDLWQYCCWCSFLWKDVRRVSELFDCLQLTWWTSTWEYSGNPDFLILGCRCCRISYRMWEVEHLCVKVRISVNSGRSSDFFVFVHTESSHLNRNRYDFPTYVTCYLILWRISYIEYLTTGATISTSVMLLFQNLGSNLFLYPDWIG